MHEDSTSRSDCNRMQSCGERIGLRHSVVSLAKRNELQWFREDDRSFIYMGNRRGPSKLPWGTQEITGRVEDLLLLMHTY